MKRSLFAGLCLAGLTASLLAGCGSTGADTTDTLRIGTGSTGGSYYAVGSVYAQLMEEAGLAPEVKSTAGSAANLRLLSEGFLQLAIVQSDTLEEAENGTGAFEGKALSGFSAVAGLYTEACQLIVAADSGIEEVADLAGMRVSIGEEESGVLRNAEQILQANGLTVEQVDASYLSFTDSAAALQSGELDAFFITAGAPTTAVAELAKNTDIRLLSLDERTIDQLTSLYDCYTACTIPAGTYAGQEEEVQTVGVTAVLVAADSLTSERVQQLTSLLLDNTDSLNLSTPVTLSEDPTAGVPVGFHPGAAACYEALGISVPTGGSGKATAVTGGQDS